MRVLHIIHGYPMRHNAGSEVYTQAVARALADRHDVRVFTRREDAFTPAYQVLHEADTGDSRVRLTVINNPESRDRYRHDPIDAALASELLEFKPDIVHVGHLNHLSTSLLKVIADRCIPIVFTLHDFWLTCPRGQFMQRTPDSDGEPYPHCTGQEDQKCAERCYSIYFSGSPVQRADDADHWSSWVHERMRHVREMASLVHAFIAPSRHLLHRFRDELGIPVRKLHLLDYGFDLQRLAGRQRLHEKPFVFGYIGTHTPAKGIHHLLTGFAELRGEPLLRIWGRARDPFTSNLRSLASSLPNGASRRIEWRGEYVNEHIVPRVFDHVDAIVVPSIWEENSPLVIHEAQQARVPVITANAGGMAEYVHHEVNGLLYAFRSPAALAVQMQRFVDDPLLARRLGERGYIHARDGNIPAMPDHIAEIESIYERVIQHSALQTQPRPGPWRITFDTNPDDCNLACIMCEEHSPLSTRQADRRAAGKPKRRMDVAMIRRVLEDSRGTPLREIIPSTMGEPLLYEHFDQIIDLCSEFGLKMNLTTNGTFPGLGAAAWAQRIVPVTSDVKISINGATAQTNEAVMVGSRWESVLSNVRAFVAVRDAHAAASGNRCRLTFQMTFLENNIDELPALIRLAAELGVDRVKGHHLWAHFTQIEGLSMRRSPDAIERWNRIVDAAHETAVRHVLANGSRVILENIHQLDPSAPDDIAPRGECPFLGQEAWISAQGRFNPCCAPDELRRTLGEFGNLEQCKLGEIWMGPAYERLRANYQEHRLCQTCNMRRPARSHCSPGAVAAAMSGGVP